MSVRGTRTQYSKYNEDKFHGTFSHSPPACTPIIVRLNGPRVDGQWPLPSLWSVENKPPVFQPPGQNEHFIGLIYQVTARAPPYIEPNLCLDIARRLPVQFASCLCGTQLWSRLCSAQPFSFVFGPAFGPLEATAKSNTFRDHALKAEFLQTAARSKQAVYRALTDSGRKRRGSWRP